MSTWEPAEKDVQWLQNIMDKLKVGGIWVAPSYGVIFHKIDESTLEVQQPLIVTPEGIEMISRTMQVGKKAGITVKKLDAVIIIPYPTKPPTPTPNEPGFFKCDHCGKPIPVGQEKRRTEKGPILCKQCDTDDSPRIEAEDSGI